MTFFHSSISKFHISDPTGTSLDISSSITRVEGIPGSRTLIDITSLTDDGPAYVVGPQDSTVTLTGIFDDDTDTVLSALLAENHTSPTGFTYAPAGTSPGSVRYTGHCWVERYNVTSSARDRVTYTATLKVQGAITRDIHTNQQIPSPLTGEG